MLFYQAAFGLCLLLLCGSYAALMAAHRRGDKRQARVLHILRLGLSFSAISYLLRITNSTPAAHPSFLIFATCLAGTAFIWLGWIEHWRMRMERLNAPAARRDEEEGVVPETPSILGLDAGLPRLSVRARQVLFHAQDEACRRQCSVDTEHLLLGLLREPHSAGVLILNLLGVNLEKVRSELHWQTGLGQAYLKNSSKRFFERPVVDRTRQQPEPTLQTDATPPELTDCARSVIALAAQEAHRFGKASIGTEHLLLGLMLAGKGKAASVLFQEGVTVDRVRDEIMKRESAGNLDFRR